LKLASASRRSAQPLPRIADLESIRGLAALQILLRHFFATFAAGA
jgi:peptidoglycan/LPS O-acetylase OafA/YrhL